MTNKTMQLRLLVPAQLKLDTQITRLKIEALDGARTLLPRYQDFFTALPAGIFSYFTELEEERFVAIDHALLVKRVDNVTITTHHAILSDSLTNLRLLVHEQFDDIDEQQKKGRTALARLEVSAIKQFVDLEQLHHG